MKPVAKGITRKFIRVTDDKESAISELKNSINREFTGRIQGILKTSKGELDVAIEVLRGRIVAAGVEGYTHMDGGLALNTIVNAIIEGTGFLEIIELNEEGVNLDLEFNPNAKLSMPTSLELYINRIELKLRQLQRKKTQTTWTPPPTPRRRLIEKTEKKETEKPRSPSETKQPVRKEEAPLRRVKEEKAPEKPEVKTKEKTATVERQKTEGEEKKKILEEIGLDEEVLEGLVVNVKEKPPVIVALPSNEGASTVQVAQVTTETSRPVAEQPVEGKPLVEELSTVPETRIEQKSRLKEAILTPEELLSKLPLSDKIEEYSKSLLSETDKLLLSLIETSNVLSHGRDKVDVVFKKILDLSKNIDKPIKLSTATAGKLYYIIVHNGSIVSAFKIDENSENIELYGRAALVDLLKKILSENIDYVVSLVKNKYMLSGLGLIKREELEQEVEERAEGLLGRLRKIFGGK